MVRSVASAEQVETAKCKFWQAAEAAKPSLKRGEPSTWGTNKTWFPNPVNGLFNSYGLAQGEFLWDARLLPGVKKAFASIWETDDLIVSYDGGNAFRPWKHNFEWLTSVCNEVCCDLRRVEIRVGFATGTGVEPFCVLIVSEWLVARGPKCDASRASGQGVRAGLFDVLRRHSRNRFDTHTLPV